MKLDFELNTFIFGHLTKGISFLNYLEFCFLSVRRSMV